MSSRDEILNSIRSNTIERFELPDLGKLEAEAQTFPDKIGKFAEMLEKAGGKCVVLDPNQTIGQVVAEQFPEAKRVALTIPDLSGKESLPGLVFNSDEVDGHSLDGTDVAIVEGSFGVSENACVWVPQKVKNRPVYFLSEALVIVIDRTALVNNMHEAYKRIANDDFDYGVFLSGPSKTADIEQALVFGAHGAHYVTVVLK